MTNMDPDRENAFWREGRSDYNYVEKLPTKVRRKRSTTINRIPNQDYNSYSMNRRSSKTLPKYPVGYKTYQWPKTRRRSTNVISNFTGTETTDEEYWALYKKSSSNGESNKSNERNFSNSSGDCIVEPIEAILSRYKPRKSSKSTIDGKRNSSIEESEISDRIKSSQELNASRSIADQDRLSIESAENGKRIETNCYGVWYSKSELNMTSKRNNSTRAKDQASRIPRLRNLPVKSNRRIHQKRASVQ